jgi:predicted nicotinamide N-methyase
MQNSEHPLLSQSHWHKVTIAGRPLEILRISDFDSFLDSVTEEDFGADERFPYWADIWPSALALSDYILRHPELMQGKRCIELGCGLGLAGIAATLTGASVLFTDYEEDALDFTRRNFNRNCGAQAETRLLDWRSPELNESFDLVLAADVLYEKRFLKPLLNTLRQVTRRNGLILLTEPNRAVAGDFFTLLQEAGMEYEAIPYPVTQDQSRNQVTLYRIRPC